MNLKFSLIFVRFFVNFITLIVLCNQNLIHGDTSELSFKDEFNLHHAFVIEKLKWVSGFISFKIDMNFKPAEVGEILWAMYEIERSSCIRFAAHNPINGPNYIMFRKDLDPDGCAYAALGCLNIGEQDIRITAECMGYVLHELLHTIGFGHHQQRSDRDQYIAIHRENGDLTDEAYSINFAKKIEFDERIKYLTPSDYESVMLYSEYMFSKNDELPFIPPTVDGAKIRPYIAVLSKYDKILLNRFYDCESVDKMKSSIFYEDEFGLSAPPVINYHEIARAKVYINEVDVVVENNVDDHQNVDDGVTQSEPIQNNSSTISIGQSDAYDRDHDDKENFVEEDKLGAENSFSS